MRKFGVIVLLISAIAVPSVLFATQGQQGTEARINAYKHEDGRVEFALQVREGSGWSERILPRGRFLGKSSPTGRWLSSTSIEVPSTVPNVRLPVYYPSHDSWGSRVEFSAQNHNDPQLWRTELKFWAFETNDSRVQRAAISFTCDESWDEDGGRSYRFGGRLQFVGVDAEPDQPVIAVAMGTTAGPFSPHSYGWYGDVGPEDTEMVWRWSDWQSAELDTKAFMFDLKQYDQLTLGIVDQSGNVVSATFRLKFWTPIQPNLDYCGEY